MEANTAGLNRGRWSSEIPAQKVKWLREEVLLKHELKSSSGCSKDHKLPERDDQLGWDTPPDPCGSHTLLKGLYNFSLSRLMGRGRSSLGVLTATPEGRNKPIDPRAQLQSSFRDLVYFHSSFKATLLWAVFISYKRGLRPLVVVVWYLRGDFLPGLEGYILELNLSFY